MIRHAVISLFYNTTDEQLELSKKALDSVLAQDIGPLKIYAVDNGSTVETMYWLHSMQDVATEQGHRLVIFRRDDNSSPVHNSNEILRLLFLTYQSVLSVPNDVILPPNAYREMLSWPRGFVSATPIEGVPLDQAHTIPRVEKSRAISECTPMCVMLTRKWAYDAIVAKDGYFFDERFDHYCSDCDLALRMAACGIRGVQLDLPVWHFRSASWRMAAPGIGKSITDKADGDREKFAAKWGFQVFDPRYAACARDINFRG
jgi:hypothetical protein